MRAVIQAGGKGTRVMELTNNEFPKPMLLIDDKPILYHQIMNLKRYGINDITIIVSYLKDSIINYFGDGCKFGVNISYVIEDDKHSLGTAGALYYLKDVIDSDFIFLLGDIFIDIDFDRFISYHNKYEKDVTLLVHPNNHPFDSDLIVLDGNRVLDINYKNSVREYYNNVVNAGVMIFSKNCLDLIPDLNKYNYEKDIIKPLIDKGQVIAYKSSEYVKDMGTVSRYKQVIGDYNNGIVSERNLSKLQKCIFLDRDGTINKYVGFLTDIDDFCLLDGVSSAIKKINESGYLCIVITNQPVVARGDVSFLELDMIHRKMETILGNDNAYIDDLFYCPHHPDKGFVGEVKELKIDCNCRKPKTGLIEEAVSKYNIDLGSSFFIGDSSTDMECARRAGITSVLIRCGHDDNKYDVKADYEFEDLEDAVNSLVGDRNVYKGNRKLLQKRDRNY